MLVSRKCGKCQEIKHLSVNEVGYSNWLKGELIQNAMPELSADDRELLISGFCGHCFDKMFSEDY